MIIINNIILSIICECIIIIILNNFVSINDIKFYIHTLAQKNIISDSNILNWINHNKVNAYTKPDVIIKYSNELKTRGVFANKDYKINDILEVCPTIKHPKNYGGPLQNYIFEYNHDTTLIGFGYCSIYNKSVEPNAKYRILNENQVEIKVVKNIKKGDEIFLA
jgi:hypothetical protein